MSKKLEIYGEGHLEPYIHNRTACRAFIEQDGKLLVSVEYSGELIVLPGGGKQKTETFEECVRREVLEESGYIVELDSELFVIKEYYDRWEYETHYFKCTITQISEPRLTSTEAENKLVTDWRDPLELQEFFHMSSKDKSLPAWKRRVYLREYRAVSEYIKRHRGE